MADYSAEVQTALEMIAEAGGPVTITSKTVLSYDPVTMEETSAPATVSPVGVDLPIGPRDNAYFGGLTVKHQRKVLCAAAAMPAFIPAPGDTLVMEGATWTVANNKRLIPDGVTDILWTLFVWR